MRFHWRWLTWDGALPLVAIGIPWLLSREFLNLDEILVFLLSIGLATILAMIRAGMASAELEAMFPGELRLGRKLLMAVAIMLLLFFDCTANFVLHILPRARPPATAEQLFRGYAFAAGLYFYYVLITAVALRPPVGGSDREDDYRVGDGGKIVFQSERMSTTIQPEASAASQALSSLPIDDERS